MRTKVLSSAPSLGPLFAKAVLTAPLRTGPLSRGKLHGGPLSRGNTTLGDSRIRLDDQAIDAAHLATYQRLCGYPVSEVLPSTYLHLLSFPLSVVRMTEADFPFPLLGLVQVRNVITQARPVRLGQTVSLAVWSDNLRPHPSGQQLDVVTEGSVDGEVVWTETTSYLRRSRSATPREPRAERVPLADPIAHWRVPADIGRKYAAVSGDRNPIHLADLTAKAFGFPKAIAHGMWLKARTLAAFSGRLPERLTVDVAFKTPVLLPSTVALCAVRSADRWSFELNDAGSGKPHLAGVLHFP